MTPTQINRVTSALARAWGVIAGDTITHIAPDETQTELVCIFFDTTGASDEGVSVGGAGITQGAIREVSFLRETLDTAGVTITAESRFLIDGALWDVMANEGHIYEAQVPIAGIHNIISVFIRKAIETASATTVTTIEYSDEDEE